MRETKSVSVAEFKALDDEQGVAEFVASVFNTQDRVKDIMQPGSFAKVIATQTRLPKFLADHTWSMGSVLGKVLEWREMPTGLYVKVQFNLDVQSARDAYSHFKFNPEGMEFSFSYDIAENGSEEKDGIRYIRELKEVFDVGPVVIGAHPDTGLLTVKAAIEHVVAEAKAGARDSRATLKLLKEIETDIGGGLNKLASYIKESTPDENTEDEKSLLTVDSDFIDTINTSFVLTDLRLSGVTP